MNKMKKIHNWCDFSIEEISLEEVKKIYNDKGLYRVSGYTFKLEDPKIIKLKRCIFFLIFGSCAVSIQKETLKCSKGEVIQLDSGLFEFSKTDSDCCELAIVWRLEQFI